MTGVIASIPKFQFSNATGTPLANGTLTVYLAGTTTLTNTWQDYQLTSLNTNPVVLDSRGECVLWLDSAVTYKFVLKNSAGVVQWTQDNLSSAGLLVFLQAGSGAIARTLQNKARESVSVADFPDLPTVISAIGSANTTLNINTPVTLSADLTVPSNISLNFTRGGIINNGAYKVIANGDVAAGLFQIFNGAGQVTIISNVRRAEWFGASILQSGAVNSAAIQAALKSFPQVGGNPPLGGTVKIGRGPFTCAPDVISFNNINSVQLEGEAPAWGYDTPYYAATALVFTAGTLGIQMSDSVSVTNSNYNTLKNIRVNGAGLISYGVRVNNQQYLEGVSIESCTVAGLHVINATNSCTFQRCDFSFNTGASGVFVDNTLGYPAPTTVFSFLNCSMRANANGITLAVGVGAAFTDCVVESNTGYGLVVYRPTSTVWALPSLSGIDFNRCHFENNGTGGVQLFQVYMGLQAHGQQNNISGIIFKHCTVSAGVVTQKYLNIDDASNIVFDNCLFIYSTASDSFTFNSTYANNIRFIADDPSTGAPTIAQRITGQNVSLQTIRTTLSVTRGNTGSIASAVATTILTLPASNKLSVYQVSANLPVGGVVAYGSTTTILWDGSNGVLKNTANGGANLSISLSGANIQVTQSSGATQASGVDWVIHQVGN
jgi:hypothetical protein